MAKTRILLIDDEVTFSQLLKINLEDTGRYEVRVENRGAGGLAAAREFQPDIIFLDLVMPDMDGAQVATHLQLDERLKHIPVIYLTAVVSKRETQAHGGKIGGQTFLAKPVSVEEIMACVEQFTRNEREIVDGITQP